MARIELPDVALRVRCFGSGEPVMLLHGLGSSGDDWAFQVGPLAAHFQLVVPDLRGCGESDAGDGGYSIGQFADDMWRLLDHMGHRRLAVVGFSMGGAVALEMALQRPQSVSRLVLINSLPSYRVDHWRKAFELYLQTGMVRLLGMRRTARMVALRLFPHPQQQSMRQRVLDVVGASQAQPYLRCAQALANWCAGARLPALGCETLMLAGELDYTGLAEKRRWAERLRAELVVIRGSRHGTPFDAIEATNACLLAFLSGQALPDIAARRLDAPEQVPVQAPEWPPQREPAVFDAPRSPEPDQDGAGPRGATLAEHPEHRTSLPAAE